jgi:hypothetical protein
VSGSFGTTIDYVHARNSHSQTGPTVAFPIIIEALGQRPASMIDVGCGTGTWLRAAADCGVADVLGIDGVMAPAEQLCMAAHLIQQRDLTQPVDLGRRFDLAVCLEVGEHLAAEHASALVSTLVRSSDVVLFSAACPGQPGQHHVNCQWPEYWQRLFNDRGYSCDDSIRWQIWGNDGIEPWYRQNMFVARNTPDRAGTEPRIAAVLHPAMVTDSILLQEPIRRWRAVQLQEIAGGSMATSWYLTTGLGAIFAKAGRLLRRPRQG